MKSLLTHLVLSMVVLILSVSAKAAERPNVMVFLVDDMGVMDSSVPFLTDENGQPKRYPLNDYYRTPQMERLAAQGIRFSQFYAMSVCSPTRISIMTGQNAARHHATNWINPYEDNRGAFGPHDWNWKGLKKKDTTLAGLMSDAGYRSIHVGKGHFAPHDAEGTDPANIGFDINIAGNAFGAPRSYYGKDNYAGNTRRGPFWVPHLEAYHGTDTFLTEALTLEAKKQVRQAVNDDKPFFLYFAHYAVHGPFNSDPRFAANYKDSGKSAPAQAFATLVEGMDKSLGDMLDLFEELGVAENTLVFFLGDNGTDAPLGNQHEVACAAPLRGKKGAHYEGGMRVPLIVSWAERSGQNPLQQKLPIPAGAIQSQMGNVTDLFPTILDITEVDAPKGHQVDGGMLNTLVQGKQDENHSQQFLMNYPHGVHRSNYFTVWRDGDWKIVHHAHPNIKGQGGSTQSEGKHYELFNLAEDPFESTDLSAKNPEQLARMVQGLNNAMETHHGQYSIDDEGNEIRPTAP